VADQFGRNWTIFAAGAVIAALPIVALFLYLQRYIVSGLIGGAVKG
jgi:arabinogalactan oligomer/maltooligosaccharide transport system permease protein